MHCSYRPNHRYRFRPITPYIQSRIGRGRIPKTRRTFHPPRKCRVNLIAASDLVNASPLEITTKVSVSLGSIPSSRMIREPVVDCIGANRST